MPVVAGKHSAQDWSAHKEEVGGFETLGAHPDLRKREKTRQAYLLPSFRNG
jgi:hypothetical protein